MKMPSSSPINYKTRQGLFNAFVRALESPPTVARAWWLTNAEYAAEVNMPDLLPQLHRLREESSPKTIDQLIPIGHSVG